MQSLRYLKLRLLVDIRSDPEDQQYPEFTQPQLRLATGNNGMIYHWAGRQLGEKANRESPPAVPGRHKALADQALQAFADYMESNLFRRAVNQLLKLNRQGPMVLLSAGTQSQMNHRILIADYLILQGCQVFHVTKDMAPKTHILSPQARRESTDLVYDDCSQSIQK